MAEADLTNKFTCIRTILFTPIVVQYCIISDLLHMVDGGLAQWASSQLPLTLMTRLQHIINDLAVLCSNYRDVAATIAISHQQPARTSHQQPPLKYEYQRFSIRIPQSELHLFQIGHFFCAYVLIRESVRDIRSSATFRFVHKPQKPNIYVSTKCACGRNVNQTHTLHEKRFRISISFLCVRDSFNPKLKSSQQKRGRCGAFARQARGDQKKPRCI